MNTKAVKAAVHEQVAYRDEAHYTMPLQFNVQDLQARLDEVTGILTLEVPMVNIFPLFSETALDGMKAAGLTPLDIDIIGEEVARGVQIKTLAALLTKRRI